MFDKLKKLYAKIRHLNEKVNYYTSDSLVKAMPVVSYVNKAQKLIDQKKFDEAKKILLLAYDMNPKDSMVLKNLGRIYEFRGDYKEAASYYDSSSRLNPTDKDIWYKLGMCSMYADLYEVALHAFEHANKYHPCSTNIYTGWGMTYMKMKKYALARDKFITAAQLSKYNYSAILLSAVMECRLGEYSNAEEKLSFLVKTAPNESSMYEYGNLNLILGKYDMAIEYAQKALEYNYQMLPAYFILGEVYSVKKDYEKTFETYNRAIKANLDSAELRFEWGKAYIRLLEFEKAREQFTLVQEKNPNFQEVKIGLSLLEAYEGKFDHAIELRQKYLDNVYIQEAIGLKCLNDGDVEYAIEAFKKALKTDKNQTYLYYDLARAYQILKNNNKVKEYFEKFVSENPKYLKGLLDYSQWLINISDFEDARRKLEKAQKLAPDNVEILNLLFLTQYTLVRKNISEYNVKEAISTAQKAIDLGKFDYHPEKQELEKILEGIGN